jgi:hypothetical protein
MAGQLSRPEVGQWYMISQDAVPVSRRDQGQTRHPWIVVRRDIAAQVRAYFRTSQPGYYGIDHDAHPKDHEPNCSIDLDGCTICCAEGREIDLHVFRDAAYSCDEPPGTKRDEILDMIRPPRRPTTRRPKRK